MFTGKAVSPDQAKRAPATDRKAYFSTKAGIMRAGRQKWRGDWGNVFREAAGCALPVTSAGIPRLPFTGVIRGKGGETRGGAESALV